MEDKKNFTFLRKNIKLLCLVLLVPVAVTLVLKFTAKPVYTANTTLFIGPGEASEALTKDDVTMYQELVNAYADIAKSTKVADDIKTNINTVYSASEIATMLIATPKPLSLTLTLSVTLPDEQQAVDISAQAAKSLEKMAGELVGEDLLTIIDEPSAPLQPESVSTKKLVVAFVGTLMLMALLVFLVKF